MAPAVLMERRCLSPSRRFSTRSAHGVIGPFGPFSLTNGLSPCRPWRGVASHGAIFSNRVAQLSSRAHLISRFGRQRVSSRSNLWAVVLRRWFVAPGAEQPQFEFRQEIDVALAV